MSYLTLSEAAKHTDDKRSPLSIVRLRQLCQTKTLTARKVGPVWTVSVWSLDKYLEGPRKPGPKGPRMNGKK